MNRAIALVAAALIGAGCDCNATRDAGSLNKPAGEPQPLVTRPLEGLPGVMQAKLRHVHTLLEAITLRDTSRVAASAEGLADLSEQSEWQVHTTLSYTVMSERFRLIARAMAEHARAENLDAVSADYQSLTASCLDCHAYLRREGLYPNMPPRAIRERADAPEWMVARAHEGS